MVLDDRSNNYICDSEVNFLRARITALIDVLRDLEEGNDSPEEADGAMKFVANDLNWFRKQCFHN